MDFNAFESIFHRKDASSSVNFQQVWGYPVSQIYRHSPNNQVGLSVGLGLNTVTYRTVLFLQDVKQMNGGGKAGGKSLKDLMKANMKAKKQMKKNFNKMSA